MKKVILLAVVLVSIFTLSCTQEEVSPVGEDSIFSKVEYENSGGPSSEEDEVIKE